MKFTEEHAELYYKVFPKHVNEHYLNKRKIFLKQFFKSNSSILDVGCGKGKLLLLLNTSRSFGVDNSKSMVGAAKKLNRKSKFSISNSYNLPFKNNFFDLTYTIATLHHIRLVSKVKQTINEMLRVTKDNGFVVIWDHNPNNLYWKLLLKRVPWDKDVRLVDDSIYRDVLNKLNISSVKILKSGFVPDFCPKFLLKLFQSLEKLVENKLLGNFLAAHTIVVIKK